MVRITEKSHLDEGISFEEMQVSSELQEKEENSSAIGLALHQIFNQDTLNEKCQSALSQMVEAEGWTSFLWNKITSWWSKPKENSVSKSEALTETATKHELIPPVPTLDPPENIPQDLQNAQLSPISKKDTIKNLLAPSEISEVLSLMSERTIESIMFIIFKHQIDLEKENANVKEGTFSKYQDFQKLRQKVLVEIKEALTNDEKIAARLKTAQNITVAASFVSGIAAAALSFGLLGPVGGFIGATAGPTAAAAFMFIASNIAKIGPAASAGLTGLTMGTKAYFKRQMNEHQAQHEEYEHQDQYYQSRMEDARDRLMTTAEMDSVFKEHWIRLLKRSDRMRKLILKK